MKNTKLIQKQKKVEQNAKKQKKVLNNKIKNFTQDREEKFEGNQKRKDIMQEKIIEKYNKLEKEMKEKQEKREIEKKEQERNLCLKIENDYLKQYDMEQKIGRLERVNIYKTEKRNEEILRKEKNLEDFKKKINEIIESKAKLTDKMEKEKKKLISDFEKSFKQKEQVDAKELFVELYPEGEELSSKDNEKKQELEKLIEKMNKSGYNNSSNLNEKGENSNSSEQQK